MNWENIVVSRGVARGVATFKQSDLTRAMKAAEKAGLAVRRYEIEKTGKIVIIPAKANDSTGTLLEPNEWDGAA